MKQPRKFQCRIEELAVIAEFLKQSFIRDQDDFAAFSPNFDDAFLSNYELLIVQVESSVRPAVLKGEKQKITRRLHENICKLRPLLDKVEVYLKMASELDIAPEDFGLAKLRHEINTKDVEGILFLTRSLLQMLDNKMGALADRGLSPDHRNAIHDLIQVIKADNLAKLQKISATNELTDANVTAMNELWDKMCELMDTGKRIYKYEDTYKLADYTFTALKRHVNREGKRKTEGVEAEVVEG